jgi:NTE family protein
MRIAEEGWIKDEYRSRLRHMLLHSIRADETLKDLSVATKFNCDWNFLTQLRDRGREAAS